MNAFLSRHFLRLGLLAAGIATVTTAGPAQAAEAVAVAHDAVRTTANHRHHTQFRDSFSVRQLGTVAAARVGNHATARSVGCTADDACRSVALSFQIVTYSGERVRLAAVNAGRATNDHCTGCQTLAGAYQFVVVTPKATRLTPAAQRRLADIHRRLDALGASRLPAAELKKEADGLAAEVASLLADPASTATAPSARPTVKVHRQLDGWPRR
ncbi:hypothetical protein [Streptomyces sp. NPDC053048]|uniref:hypothetical protein n=1 Tax=Streptomyces sp. NPDC053048 TaxID=3365694 RepID=UPI0037D54713